MQDFVLSVPPNKKSHIANKEMYYSVGTMYTQNINSQLQKQSKVKNKERISYVLVSCVTNDPKEIPTITFHVPL